MSSAGGSGCRFASLLLAAGKVRRAPASSMLLRHVLPTLFCFAAGRKPGAKLPDLHTVHRVTILKAFHDGIFVNIPNYEADGLIHHSQISRNLTLSSDIPKAQRYHKIQELIGDIDYDVYVKVVYVADEKDHTKCECSLKMVRTQLCVSSLLSSESLRAMRSRNVPL